MVKKSSQYLYRREVVKQILSERSNVLVVSGLGSSTYDVHAAGDNNQNFYLWGGMGGASMIGLGLALAQPKRKVFVITGDGEQLMGLGSLATIGVKRPRNLTIFVLDNECFAETGMQESHTAEGVDLAKFALGSGCKSVFTVYTKSDLFEVLKKITIAKTFSFVVIKIARSSPKRSLPIVSGVEIKNRFRKSLGLE